MADSGVEAAIMVAKEDDMDDGGSDEPSELTIAGAVVDDSLLTPQGGADVDDEIKAVVENNSVLQVDQVEMVAQVDTDSIGVSHIEALGVDSSAVAQVVDGGHISGVIDASQITTDSRVIQMLIQQQQENEQQQQQAGDGDGTTAIDSGQLVTESLNVAANIDDVQMNNGTTSTAGIQLEDVAGGGIQVMNVQSVDDIDQVQMMAQQGIHVVTLDLPNQFEAMSQSAVKVKTEKLEGEDDLPAAEGFISETPDGEGNMTSTLSSLDTPNGGSVLPVAEPQLTQTVQAVTLADGTTAILQQVPKGCQAVQLEDGTMAFIQSNAKMTEGVHTIQLEDGTTAYITHMTSENFLSDNATLDPTSLSLEHFTQSADSATPSQVEASSKVSVAQATVGMPSLMMSMNAGRISSERAIALGDKAYQCQYDGCGRLYTTLHHLKVHERSHTGDRPFKCSFAGCGKAFATGYGLKSHTRVHTGEKPYKCPEETCEKGFKTSGDLQKHVRTHTGERPFKCPFQGCDRGFTTSNIRKVHIRTHTGERPYICEAEGCNKAFASATNYKNHIRIHTGEKPYVCTVEGCNKRFTEYSSLYKHHVVHTHTKPYLCNHCGKNYRQTSTLAMHKRTAHGEDIPMDSEAALLMAQEDAESPPAKQPRLQIQLTNAALGNLTEAATPNSSADDGEGALVINTSESQQAAMVSSDTNGSSIAGSSAMVADEGTFTALQMGQMTLQQLQQAHGLTLTTADGGEQILVVSDPSQLEALQQLAAAQQQFTEMQNVQVDPGVVSTTTDQSQVGLEAVTTTAATGSGVLS